MEKEFVPYEQALSLKELGFNERPCFATWIERDKRDGGVIVIEMWGDEDTEYNVISEILAPTFSQAFRWFREKYKLSGLIEIGTQEFSYQVFDNKWNRQLGTESINYNGTYEEAELECLKKIMEIVKNGEKSC